jgi:hypothetical protein
MIKEADITISGKCSACDGSTVEPDVQFHAKTEASEPVF